MCNKTERLLSVFLAVFAAGILMVELCAAQQRGPEDSSRVDTDTSQRPVSNRSDIMVEQRILSRLHQINQLEIKAGKMAVERGNSDWVRKYGDRLIRDHRSTDKKVLQLAEEADIELVGSLLDEKRPRKRMQTFEQMIRRLETVEGEEFDHLFLKMMIMSHRQSLDILRTFVEKLQNADVRKLIEKVIPILDQHRQLARNIQADEVV